jgi:GntR family transcriptional regulator
LGGASMLRFFRFRQSDERSATPTSTILKRHVELAASDVADAFGQPAGSRVLQLQRLRSISGQPCLLEQLTLPLPLFDALTQSDTAAWDDLLYPMYQRVCNVSIYRAEDTVSFGLLSTEQAALLQLDAGHPCAQVQRRAFDMHGHCVELRTTLGDAFAFQYTAQIR